MRAWGLWEPEQVRGAEVAVNCICVHGGYGGVSRCGWPGLRVPGYLCCI